jgi:hypothetical protein
MIYLLAIFPLLSWKIMALISLRAVLQHTMQYDLMKLTMQLYSTGYGAVRTACRFMWHLL